MKRVIKMNVKMWLIWKEPKERRRYVIGELSYVDSEGYEFKYINPEIDDAIRMGFDYFPGFNDLSKVYKSYSLFANIETRLPNQSRPDYLKILNFYGLDVTSSKMEILKKTKGRLLTDNYEFVPVFDEQKIVFEIAGTRHYLDYKKLKKNLKINDNLELVRDFENPSDKYAIKVVYSNLKNTYLLGYVPRFYSKQLAELLDNQISYSAKVESLNFESDLSDEDITVSVKLIFDLKKE